MEYLAALNEKKKSQTNQFVSVYDRVSTEPVGGTLSTSPLGPADQSDHSVQLYHKGEGTSSTSHLVNVIYSLTKVNS